MYVNQTRTVIFRLLIFASFTLNLAAQNWQPLPKQQLEAINKTEMRMHLEFLASTELGGRYTLSPGAHIVARYLATRLEAYGYKPATGNDYLQKFNLVIAKPVADKTSATLTLNAETQQWQFPAFRVLSTASKSISGDLVFIGYGNNAPSLGLDDYARVDVRGKIVVLAAPAYGQFDRTRFQDDQYGIAAARLRGAAGVIYLPSAYQARLAREGAKKPGFAETIKALEQTEMEGDEDAEFPAIRPLPEMAETILKPLGWTLDQLHEQVKNKATLVPRALPGAAQINITVDRKLEPAQNVIGILPGADPKLRKEYVAFSAHYDHLQTNSKGQIYPGADDDGSGTSGLLNLAKVMAERPPKRSVAIIFHVGEELGLFGATYNTKYKPAVPLQQIVALFNMDMIGRSKPAGETGEGWEHTSNAETIYVVGSDKLSTELDDLSRKTNAECCKLNLDYLYNNPLNPERIYYRSDHWEYAKNGVPIIFYFDGVSPDYHQPTDTLEKIDYNKMVRVTRLAFSTGWRVANREERLRVDKASNAKSGTAD